MANGMTRNAISQLILKGKGGKAEMDEQLAILKKGHADKIPLKYSSKNNHSKDTLRSKKGGL